MAEVVEADASESGPVEEATEAAGEVGRVERPASRRGGYGPAVAPVRSGCFSLLVLAFLVLLEGMDAFSRERDTALGGPGLGGQDGRTAGRTL